MEMTMQRMNQWDGEWDNRNYPTSGANRKTKNEQEWIKSMGIMVRNEKNYMHIMGIPEVKEKVTESTFKEIMTKTSWSGMRNGHTDPWGSKDSK